MRVPSFIRAVASVLVAALAPCSVLAQALSATLTASDYNGFHISCFGKQDGSITAAGNGGTPPYSYEWTTGDMVATISGLDVGYYRVTVKDATGEVVEVDITLVQPAPMKVEANAHVYPNGHNISLYNVYNGSIDVVVADGVTPYSYQWADGPTTQDRTGLGDGNYEVVVSDANGCESIQTKLYLTQPERSDWTMSGNTGSTPGTHYIGTADAKDVVFKSNGVESLRLLPAGGVKLTGLAGMGGGFVKMGGNGLLSIFPMADVNPSPYEVSPVWYTTGNTLVTDQPHDAFMGSIDAAHVEFRSHNQPRQHILSTGEVGIVDRLGIGFNLESQGLGQSQARLTVKELEGRWVNLAAEWGGTWRLRKDGGAGGTAIDLAFDFTGTTPMLEQSALVLHAHGGFSSSAFTVHPDGEVTIGENVNPVGLLNVGPNFSVYPDGVVRVGDVSINTPNYGYKLYVEGGLLTEKVRVAIKSSAQWSDSVFDSGYELMPLTKVRDFIGENCHLPGVPSADEIVRFGLDVAETDAVLLKKIEELTLYIIALEGRIESLEGGQAKPSGK